MTTKINATTTTGVILSPDNSGALELQTNNGTSALTIDTSQNATFVGKLTSAGALTLASNGTTTAVTIDTSQNVGIGTTSPDALLTVNTIASFGDGAVGTPSIAHKGDLNTGLWFPAADTIAASTAGSERMRIDSTGNVSITQAAGKYTIDTTGGTTSIANGGTVDYSNASGMLIANNHTNGAVTIYLCGGGSTSAVSNVGTQVGTFAYVAGIGGYRWTNNYGSTANFGFFFVRTRNTA